MLKGIKRILTKLTIGDEYGVYRETEEKHQYLLFVCTNRTETINRGKALAKLLNLKFQNWIPELTDEQQKAEDSNAEQGVTDVEEYEPKHEPSYEGFKELWPGKEPRPKKVMGVSKLCRQYLAEQKTDEQIVENILPLYLAVGRRKEDAISAIQYILSDVKRNKEEI